MLSRKGLWSLPSALVDDLRKAFGAAVRRITRAIARRKLEGGLFYS